MSKIFATDKKIRLGIWGLGRGMSFYDSCRALNFDVVAGCDYNQHMRDNFLKQNPGSYATADAKEFLAMDFDAVLLATYCVAHADDAIACLRAGKHVLSEVTSFHTMAEGVRLVEEVEKHKLVYNLAENYPFTMANMWLARKWREGFFGELMYAEYEYVHETRTLAYTYIDGTPINPGNQLHSWRSWLNGHFYNTHSLGPMMHISGQRPTRVVALPGTVRLRGFAKRGLGGVAPSLITMSNGAIVRNLMGGTTSDSHTQRIWGTNAAAEIHDGKLRVRVGASGHGPILDVKANWGELGELASTAGHGGGDFWVLYYFARHILFGEPGPFEIYKACDCTIPGILAYRSARENGQAYDVPDFRDPVQRALWRDDNFDQPKLDPRTALFPADQDTAVTLHFSETMRDLVNTATLYRAYRDAKLLMSEVHNPSAVGDAAVKLLQKMPMLQQSQQMAQRIVARHPDSLGAQMLQEMLDLSEPAITGQPTFAKALRKECGQLNQTADKWLSPFLSHWRAGKLTKSWQPVALQAPQVVSAQNGFVNLHPLFGKRNGIAHATCRVRVPFAGAWEIRLGHDGGAKLFVDRKLVAEQPERRNPAIPDRTVATVKLTKGVHTLQVALDTANGLGWGFFLRFAIPVNKRKRGLKLMFPEAI
ncbi:MAG: hypothetical protein PCFJNLEI_02742 [Verrucomicrobiae bacterium]|nr:hypothetical protein [Verrucomicrobiae bacterium]